MNSTVAMVRSTAVSPCAHRPAAVRERERVAKVTCVHSVRMAGASADAPHAGKNKIANILHLKSSGFSFHVHGSGFIVHRPHAPSAAKAMWKLDKHGPQQVPLNTLRLEAALPRIAAADYVPTLSPESARCIRRELSKIEVGRGEEAA